jgi:secondary thiamine-phosphate synthase enzyme
MINQTELNLDAKSRGFHLITKEITRNIGNLPKNGLLNIFTKHTSCGLTLNENCDSSVRADFESCFNKLIPEDEPYYTHTAEGSDDMPAHIKSTITGTSITVPITDGKLNLGTWQGVYLCEFRNDPNPRKLVLTIFS